MAKVPKQFQDVFWEVDSEQLDTEKNPEYIMERILEYGTLEGVKWVRKTIGDKKIKEFITGRARRSLSSKTLNFWQKILKLRPEECIDISSRKAKYSFWEF